MNIKLFNWYGGKQRVLPEIYACVPPDITHWYDACMGSAVVTLNAPRHQFEMLSDLDDDLIHLVSLLADRVMGKELMGRLIELPYCRSVFDKAIRARDNKYHGMDDYERAEAIFVSISQSFDNLRGHFRKPKSPHFQYSYTEELMLNLPEVYRRLQGVTVRKMDCVDVVEKVKHNPKAFVFLDVPYRWELRGVGATDVYGFEMDRAHHIRLLEMCRDARCCIMLCGYRQTFGTDLYDRYLSVGQEDSPWRHYTLAELVKTCQTKKRRDVATETIWVNYELPPEAKYYISMKEIP